MRQSQSLSVLLALAVVAGVSVQSARAQQQANQGVTVVKWDVQPNAGDGSYSFSYELSDGTARTESGSLQKAGTPDEFMQVQGSYKFTSPEGWVTQVDYTADDTGYHPKVQLLGGGLSGSLVASLVG